MAQIAVRTQQKNAFQPRSYRQHASHQRIRDYFMQGIKSSRVMSYSFESGFSLQNEIGGSLPSDAEVSAIIERAVVDAKASPAPAPADLYSDVYINY